ncbi:InlB B-repeat-containing protein [Clostridium sp. JN-9]|uniref:InlB B-repeat-containing protein n=1 Tax=Clostridium sp. JN-9 TaxID=2507159 RepID=UPI00196A763D|nr:InlB B-repeat-containing protein [Clostridium sp. JN-9]
MWISINPEKRIVDNMAFKENKLNLADRNNFTFQGCDTSNVIDKNNVISLISGNAVNPIQNTEQSTQTTPSMSKLEMKSKLIKWVLNEPTNTLCGISKDDKALFFINAETLNLEKSITFPSSPTDIIQDGGNLYIALDDINEIVIVDLNKRTITGIVYTSSADPYRIEKDGDRIYYIQRREQSNIYQYDLTTKTDEKIPVDLVFMPDIAINTEDHILYIGESELSDSNMIYYSTTENKVTGKTNYNNGRGFPYLGRYTLFDGEKVYYAGFAFDKHIPTRILGSFDNEEVIFAKYGSAFTKTGLYDSETYSLLGDISSDLTEISNNFVSFYYKKDYNSIYRVDPTKMSQVLFDSQGGSDVDYIIADKDTLIQAPDSPTRPGYTFEGWYKEAECINKWDFAAEKVTSNNITLYAKWSAAANGWCYSQGKWYFFKNSSMVTNGWTQDSAKHWYYMGADGAMVTNTWVQDSLKRWYYMGVDGAMVTNTWKQDASKSWYYLGSDGSMAANKWILDNGKWYYLKTNGAMATGWISYGGGWYYLYSSGEMAKSTTIDGYKLNASGMWIR